MSANQKIRGINRTPASNVIGHKNGNGLRISTVYDHDTFAWLKETAEMEEVSIAEVVRRCIDFARHTGEEGESK